MPTESEAGSHSQVLPANVDDPRFEPQADTDAVVAQATTSLDEAGMLIASELLDEPSFVWLILELLMGALRSLMRLP
jgi:hypothetical protein